MRSFLHHPGCEVVSICDLSEQKLEAVGRLVPEARRSMSAEDILNDGFRRMLVNASLWAVGLEDDIKPDGPIGLVGPYNPVTFKFGGFRKNVKPADIAGWDTPILGPK